MSAAEALKAARGAGVGLRLDGGNLVLEGTMPPSAEILERLACHKPGIVALLRAGEDGWPVDDWRALYDERAGIAEFDGGLPRPEAEACAFACCIAEWLNRNSLRSPPSQCLGCGGPEQPHDRLLPFGTEATGHAWLHRRCWSAWHADRKADAVKALTAMGITEGSTQR